MNNLLYQLMTEIGLEVDSELRIVDQDDGNIIMFKGKSLKVSIDGIRQPFIGRNDILFDPITNFKVMNNLFSYFIHKTSVDEGRYFSIFYPVNLPNGTTYIEIKEDNNIIRSNAYMNPCLAYIDLIFRINGESYNLSMYDVPLEEVYNRSGDK